MDKKSIVLLITSSIIFIVAVIFAVWSFTIDLSEKENELTSSDISNNGETNSIIVQNKIFEDFSQNSKTKDFSATYIDFSVKDSDGKILNLSDYAGYPVMILFWNDINEDAVEMLNRINAQYKDYKDTIKFIAIYTGEKTENNFKELDVPVYYDNNEEVAKLYNITELPTMIYINNQNEIFNAKTGLTTIDALKANLDILAENF